MKTVRLTMGQALVRFLMAQRADIDGNHEPLFKGVFAIFGHGNVAGLGEALYDVRESFPTYRAHNEQAMAMAAIAYGRTRRRRQMMACTTSVGPGATNMVTAAALAHVNRLPVLFLPGDVFAGRQPDPVLQQIENPGNPGVVANDCFKPVSRYWDRITRPEQLVTSLPQAMRILNDPAECGPATICLPQDVQAEAWDYPLSFFEPRLHGLRRTPPDPHEFSRAVDILKAAKAPLVIAGGGVLYSGAEAALEAFARRFALPVAVTQAGKGAITSGHPCAVGAVGVTGTTAANVLAREADVVLAIGTRLSDFTTGSRSLFENPDVRLINLNISAFDAAKHAGAALVADARTGLEALSGALPVNDSTTRLARIARLKEDWTDAVRSVTEPGNGPLPTDAQILAAVNRAAGPNGTVVCAAGGLPGELHKLWDVLSPDSYHVEYGYSCMGYEIAGGLGVKMAAPDRDILVMVGDGSYLMMNSEIATSVLMGCKLTIIVIDNGGYGCINRLQNASMGASFNNLFDDGTRIEGTRPVIDFAAHAQSLGAATEKVDTIDQLAHALERARQSERTTVIVINADPAVSTEAGGHWWDVPVAATSGRATVQAIHERYLNDRKNQKTDG